MGPFILVLRDKILHLQHRSKRKIELYFRQIFISVCDCQTLTIKTNICLQIVAVLLLSQVFLFFIFSNETNKSEL